MSKFKALLFVTVCNLSLFPTGGCTKTVYLEREKIVEVKEYVTETDTIFVPMVEREEVERVTEIQDTSRLSTKYATSEAFVSGGQLHHSLWNRPEAFKFDIKIPTLHRDSTIRIREPYPVEVIKEVRHVPTIYKVCFGIVIAEIIALLGLGVLKFRRLL